MKRAFFILANVLALCGAASAATPTAPVPTASAPFGCDARAPRVCHFRIFYTRGDRIVILPSGMKNKVPGVTIGGHYCMTLDQSPVYKCARKVINDKYNS
ncbi:hypothetical protein [uncultured Bradyrhizobium sp.]|uniref:hypothetical protein n=1 Tax=uncultured Bradyrhizobium sp. TaxID=199684 RepID=UPI0035CC5090